uniref:Mediator of RNA polymerase II transcription subunit 23 n=1 Tax=Globodera rostochiensis TaxID=31243 RepID=A0A914HSB4_GLORO
MNDSNVSTSYSAAATVLPPSTAIEECSAQSPSFNFLCVGNEAEKLKWLVLNHVKPNTLKKMFAPLMTTKRCALNRADELVCVQACMLFRSLEPPESDRNRQPVELEQACYSLIGLLTYNSNIITLLLTCQLLVASIDFRMKIPLNPEKIKFVRKSMDQLDYKNMRDLLKLLLVEKLDKMQCQLTEHQQRHLAPIESLVIDLIDRSKNYCPALFFITEISRIDPCHSSIHFLPRVSWKIREMVASFRPLAEIGSMLGRSWMWPVPTSPCFSWSSQTWSAWKLDEKQCKLYFKTHLPYSSENTTPQTYLQYILFKQPHGQDNLNHILRSANSMTPTPRIQCDEVIQLLILEAMCAMEDSEQPVLASVNQYNWLHLSHLVTHALFMQNCTLSELLKMLLPQLRSCQYLRAKEELMWILLQLVAHARHFQRLIHRQEHKLGNDLFHRESTKYAAIWINLVHSAPNHASSASAENQPPEKLKTLIGFIEQQLDSSKLPDDKALALLAVIANSYSNSREVFEEHVSTAVFRILGFNAQHPQGPSHQPEKFWCLPGGRRTEHNLRALDLTFLDSLTFHAKMQIYKSTFRVFGHLFSHSVLPNFASLRLPTPALAESTARLLLSTELIDLNGSIFYTYIFTALKSANIIPNSAPEQQLYFVRNDLLAMFLELLNFRLQNIGFGWKWTLDQRLQFFFMVLDSLNRGPLSVSPCPSSNSLQLCFLLEQFIQRFVQCTWPQDLLNATQCLMKMMPGWMMAMPEYCRLFQLAVFRAAKLLGADQLQFSSQDLGQRWSLSELRWFPPNILHAIVPSESDLTQLEQMQATQQAQAMMELHNMANQEMQRLMQLDAEYFGLDSPPNHPPAPSLLVSIFRCLHEYATAHPQLPHGKQPHPNAPNFLALCYKLLSLQSNRDLHRSTNALVDYLVWKHQGSTQQGPSGMLADDPLSHQQLDLRMVAVLNDMLFVHQFISVERFLLSLALHPSDDSSIRTSLFLLATLLDKFSSFSDRLHACHAFAPAHSNTTGSNSEEFFVQIADFFKKYPEYSYAELYRKTMMDPAFQQSQEQPRDPHNLPIYYGHLADRIIPLIDVILQRALEVDVGPKVLDTFLRHFAHLYRLHPQPMTFLYKTLYTLDAFHRDSAVGRQIIRKFVLSIVLKLEQDEGNHGTRGGAGYQCKLLTAEFMLRDHEMPAIRFCRVLVERIVQASTYTHQPPQFVHKDWRFAEYPPAGQALTSAWVEILATNHAPATIVDALVELAIRRPIFRPQDTLNALGLLLTGLPSAFQTLLLDRVEESFEWPQIASPDADPSQLFESLSHEVYLHSDSRILSMLALIHSFCQHGGNNSLSIIPDLVVKRLAHKVENEAQLVYFLRIVVPYLQRIHEKERNKHMPEIVAIYTVLGNLVQKVGRLKYEDTICDLLYQFKYMFVGYSLKEQTEMAIRNFPDSMREKLKFLFTHSSTAAAAAESQQQVQQILQQQQQQLQHQSSQWSMSSVPTGGVPLTSACHPSLLPSGSFPPLPSLQQQQPTALVGMLQRQNQGEERERQQQHQSGGPSVSIGGGAAQQQQQQINSNQHPQQLGSMMGGSATNQQQPIPTPMSVSSVSSAAVSPNLMNPQQQIVPPPPPYQMHSMMMSGTHAGAMPLHNIAFPPSSSGAGIPPSVASTAQQQPSMVMHSHALPSHHHLHQQQIVSSTQFQQQHLMMQQQQMSNPFGSSPNATAEGLSPGIFLPMGFQPHQQMQSHQMTSEHHQPPDATMSQQSFPSHYSQSGPSGCVPSYHRPGMRIEFAPFPQSPSMPPSPLSVGISLLPIAFLINCSFLLSPLALLPVSATPFDRFPISPSGIYRLGTDTLGDYQKKLQLLDGRVNALEDSKTPKKTRRLKLAEMLMKNGFRDEAQLKYLRHVVKWELEERQKARSGI